MEHKILIVDDEILIIKMLKMNLESHGYKVFGALNSTEALEKLSYLPDLILLDINMEGMNGIDLCIKIRDYITCPIIFLTALATEEDKINGLIVGADDYITKPFSIDELLARIQAHLRRETRTHIKTKSLFTNDLVIDYTKHQVYLDDNTIEFSKKEFDIIKLLSMNANIIFDKEKIYERVWGYNALGDSNVIKEHIRKIRLKLANYTDKEYLETIHGVGYRWKK